MATAALNLRGRFLPPELSGPAYLGRLGAGALIAVFALDPGRAVVLSRAGAALHHSNSAEPLWQVEHQCSAGALCAQQRWLALAHEQIEVFDLEDGARKQTLAGHDGEWIREVHFSQDGKLLISAGEDFTVKVWDAASGELLRSCEELVGPMALRPDRKVLACIEDERLVLRDLGSDMTLKRLDQGVTAAAFDRDGDHLAVADSCGAVKVYDAAGNELLHQFAGHQGAVTALCFSPSGTLLASGGEDAEVRVWSLVSADCRHQFQGHEDTVWSLSFGDSDTLFSCGGDRSVYRWSLGYPDDSGRFAENEEWICALAFSPDGKLLASAGLDHKIRLRSTADRRLLTTLEGHLDAVSCLEFANDSSRLASAGEDYQLRLWDVQSGGSLVLEGHRSGVTGLCFYPQRDWLVSGDLEGQVLIWSRSGELLHTLTGPIGGVDSLHLQSGGTLLLALLDDGTSHLWDLAALD